MKPSTALLLVLLSTARPAFSADDAQRPFGDSVVLRGSLDASRSAFERNRKGRVAFMGGSITEMNGFRPLVCESLKKRFPATTFDFVDAGISSTCSTTGAFRLEQDVLGGGPVDLFFVEFAVNDDQDAHHARTECIRGLEGIVRHARRSNPHMDVVVVFFVNEKMLETLRSGGTPLTIEAHGTVAKHYGLSTIDVAGQVAREISAGTLTWKEYGGVHPAPRGNALCARMIDELFDRAWKPNPARTAEPAAHPLPEPLDPLHYGAGRFLDPPTVDAKSGWTSGVPDWKSLAGSKRPRFAGIPLLSATEPGAELTLGFDGTAVGAYVVAGPDAGIAEASIDGGPFRAVDLFHAFSKGLHYPRTVLLGSELKPGRHVLRLRISGDTTSGGHAMRIVRFVAN